MSRRRKPKPKEKQRVVAAVAVPVAPPVPKGPFGERIKALREQRGFSLSQVAEETKIGLRYLEALERNDFESLPGGVFNRGFVRAYAQFIGADTERLVREYAREEESRGLQREDDDLQALKATLERQAPSRRTFSFAGPGLLRLVVIAGLVAGAAAVAGWAYVRHVTTPRAQQAPLGPALAWNSSATEPVGTSSDAAPPVATLPVESRPVSGQAPAPPPEVESPRAQADPPADIEIAAVAEPQPEAAGPALPSTGRLSIPDFGVGERVVDRQLQGRADRFPEGTDVSFWTRVVGGEPGQRITHLWFHEGREVGRTELRIGGSHWRTQSRRHLPVGSTGQWTVEARDADGRTLAIAGFACEGSESNPAR